MRKSNRSCAALAGAGLLVGACSSSGQDVSPPKDASIDVDAGGILGRADASLAEVGAGRDATAIDALAADVDSPPLADAADPPEAAVAVVEAGPPQAFIRLANWAPDAPSAGYDFCVAPVGTTAWIGPLLAGELPAGSLGAGPANGVQFPSVTAYIGVAPGHYDLQLVNAGATDCTTGVVPTTMGLPILLVGSHTTFAATGDVHAINDDSSLKVGGFEDDVTSDGSSGVTARFLNAEPGVAAVTVGTGDLASGTFAPIWVDAQFAATPFFIADGGASDPNGYALIPPFASVELSAHAVGATKDLVTAAHVTAAAGSVVTFAIVNGKNGGLPPQLFMCQDDQPARGSLSPCDVIIGK
jgi:hypothetical protein